MYNTHCIFHLIHRYSACSCRSVETHGYIFLDLHKQTDRLYKLLDDQKNHTNREQSLTLTIYFYTITLTVKVENLVIWKGTSQLTFKVFGFFFALKKIYIYILWLILCSYISLEITFVNFLTSTEWRSVIFFSVYPFNFIKLSSNKLLIEI